MTTTVPGRRPPENAVASSIFTAARNGNSLLPIPRSLPTPAIHLEPEHMLEPLNKRRKLSCNKFTTRLQDENLVGDNPISTANHISHPSARSLAANPRNQTKPTQSYRPSLRPARPSKSGYQTESSDSSRLYIRHTRAVSNVSTRPYVPEAPTLAPRGQNLGK